MNDHKVKLTLLGGSQRRVNPTPVLRARDGVRRRALHQHRARIVGQRTCGISGGWWPTAPPCEPERTDGKVHHRRAARFDDPHARGGHERC